MIGSLLYLTNDHPDISFNVGVCTTFEACQKESHIVVVKRIFKYVNDASKFEIWYPYGTIVKLVTYSNAN